MNRKIPSNHIKIINIAKIFLGRNSHHSLKIYDGMNLLIVYPRRIGDCVMAIPLLRHLKAQFDVRITIAAPRYFKDFLNDQRLYDEFIDFGKSAGPVSGREWIENRKEIIVALRKIRTRKFDIAIEPFGDCFATLFLRLCRAKYYVGIGIGNMGAILDYASSYNDNAHISDNMLELFEELGGKKNDNFSYPIIIPTHKWMNTVGELKQKFRINNRKVIGIHCGASIKQKKWPYFGELVRLIKNNHKDVFFVFFVADENEKEVCDIISYVGLNCDYIMCKLKLRDYIDYLNLCSVVICNDSGCGHLCAAQGVDVVVIYGPYLPVIGSPRGKCAMRFLSKDLPCKPCDYFSCRFGSDYKCLRLIEPEMVYNEVNELLMDYNDSD